MGVPAVTKVASLVQAWAERPGRAAFGVVTGIFAIGLFDLITGTELRVYPLYLLPISLGAWVLGRRAALVGSGLAMAAWVGANTAAGMTYSAPWLWPANAAMQGVAFGGVSILIAWARTRHDEQRLLSESDPLTQLPNRRAFYERTAAMAASCNRRGTPIALAYIDLDNFKMINDRFGHEAGDAVLCAVAKAMVEGLRATDVLGRLGGDEFAICLPDTDIEQASAVLERLLASLRSGAHGLPEGVTATIGGVVFLPTPRDTEAMVGAADAEMYEAKRNGKNRVSLRRA